MSEELRVATNTVELVGAVKELKNLEVKKNDQGEKYISGNIVVKCGETSEVTLKVFKKELTRELRLQSQSAPMTATHLQSRC